MKRIMNILVGMALLLAASFSFGQATTTETTLSSAVTATNANRIVVASATGITAPNPASLSAPSVQLYIDGEMMDVTAVNGTTISVRRGVNGTRAILHLSGAIVYAGPAGGTGSSPFYDYAKLGSCTPANEPFLPAIDYYDQFIFDCNNGGAAATVVGSWVQQATATYNTPVSQVLTAAYTNATTTFSNVTPFAFAVHAGRSYTYSCRLIWQGSATTTGPKYQFTGPGSPSKVAANAYSSVTASTYTQASATAFSSAMANAGTITATTNFVDNVVLGFVNGVNSGTVQLQAAANGAGTLTIQPGSYCIQQ